MSPTSSPSVALAVVQCTLNSPSLEDQVSDQVRCAHSEGDGGWGQEDDGQGTGVAVEEGRPKLKEPRKYAVILHNDDYTTMEFVLEVLQRFFQKNEAEAYQVMMKVHQQGHGVAGVYSFEIAETKAAQVHEAARGRGFPLRATIESQ